MLASDVPSPLSRERVAAIAALANLELDDSELDLFARQLAEILAYAEESRLPTRLASRRLPRWSRAIPRTARTSSSRRSTQPTR